MQKQTTSKPEANGSQTKGKGADVFEVNDWLEDRSREKAAHRSRYEMSYSLATKQSVDAYERARLKAEKK